MPKIKLHVKTTLLASVITIGMLVTALIVTSTEIANLERDDDKALAEIQAIDLARYISDIPSPHDLGALTTAANLTKGSRPNIVSVRIWDRTADGFAERVAAPGSLPAEPIANDVRDTLLGGLASKAVDVETRGSSQSLYRVFATIFQAGKPTGAVEIVERFDSISSIAFRYVRSVVWMSLVTIVLIMVGTYFLFRHLVYQPVDKLLGAMSRAKTGDLEAHVPVHSSDELGLLTQEFNSMLGQVRDMGREREAQQDILRQRVRDATSELEFRNQQLQETNLELWRTTRRMNELGRLAAAGQTAAHFAHEVGTPLNLISGHVQLLKSDLERDPHDAEARIKTISAQIERIERIVRRMLDKTRFETELSPLDLNALLRRLCDAMSPAFDKRDINLVFDLEENLPLIAASADRLQQLFLNLINNSLDAMPEGGELLVSTGIGTSKNGKPEQVIVDFADTGIGMTQEIMDHIFDPLYTTKQRGHGTGLGLVIVNQIIVEHGGSIEVKSEPGRGTRFRLVFTAIQSELFSKVAQRAVIAETTLS